jgi:glucan phosphoethanolaminetransferase (alkaline phosphatase superfamily)
MNRVASLIISIYIAAFLYANVFFIEQLTITEVSHQLFWNHLAIFLILLVPIYFLTSRFISLPYVRGMLRPLRTIFLSLMLLGLVISVLYHVVPLEPIYDLPVVVDQFFASDFALTIWLIIPLLALFI